ncbi:protein kinase domain-containing protein [Oceanobacillus sp. FSL W7-1309]|uniref:protein kinase domain-containing protein n=1 Tax=Oceanobacillus sp. FSL W7-1309 TaxID=2954539 RepID=UPI0030F78F7E
MDLIWKGLNLTLRIIRKIFQLIVDRPIKNGVMLNDRYEVLSVIGVGSFGIVYLCKDLKANEKRVVKQLRPSKHRIKNEMELFENEIVVLRTLSHKHIPMLIESFSSNRNLFYVMSLMEGDNLEDQIFSSKKAFNEKDSLLILSYLLELVDYIHSKGIYHQDLRIPNILLNKKDLFLIDFGLAKYSATVDPHHSHEGILKLKQQDYYDLGEILLFLLYTTYSSKNKKALPWTEELSLKKETVYLLKRLVQINEPYSNMNEILADLHSALKAQEPLSKN